MMDEMEDMMMDEIDENEEWAEDTWMELEKARGEKLIDLTKKKDKKSGNDIKPLEQIILKFEDTDKLNEEDTYKVSIKALSITIGEWQGKDNNIFKKTKKGNLIGKRFLEYLAWNNDNEIGPILELTLAFEGGYSIQVSCCSIIEEYK